MNVSEQEQVMAEGKMQDVSSVRLAQNTHLIHQPPHRLLLAK
jgi:hypothetical protein